MARKTQKPKEPHAETKIITIRIAFIPAPNPKGTRQPIIITDTEGREHQIQPRGSLEEDVRTFVACRTLSIAKGTNDRWEVVPIPPAQSKTAPTVPQSALL